MTSAQDICSASGRMPCRTQPRRSPSRRQTRGPRCAQPRRRRARGRGVDRQRVAGTGAPRAGQRGGAGPGFGRRGAAGLYRQRRRALVIDAQVGAGRRGPQRSRRSGRRCRCWRRRSAASPAQGIGMVVRVACAEATGRRVRAERWRRAASTGCFSLARRDAGPEVWKAGRALPYVGCGQTPGSDVAAPGETIERRGLALACAYLQQLGHRHIGIIGRRRERGRRSACAVAGRRHDDRAARSTRSMTRDAVRAAVRRLIENAARPSWHPPTSRQPPRCANAARWASTCPGKSR